MTNNLETERGFVVGQKIELPEEALVTYKFYTSKGERLAIFGVPDNEAENDEAPKEHLKVLVFKCSKEDEFSKNKAKQALLLGAIVDTEEINFGPVTARVTKIEDVHPETFIVPLEGENSAKYTFMKFCNENFYKVKRQIVPAVELTFVGKGKSKFLGFEHVNQNVSVKA